MLDDLSLPLETLTIARARRISSATMLHATTPLEIRPMNKGPLLPRVIAIVLSLAALVAGVSALRDAYVRERSWRRATGTIVGFDRAVNVGSKGRQTTTYAANVEFEWNGERRISRELDYASCFGAPCDDVGERVPILVSPRHPDRIVFDEWNDNWRVPLGTFGLAVPLHAYAAFVLFTALRSLRWRMQRPLMRAFGKRQRAVVVDVELASQKPNAARRFVVEYVRDDAQDAPHYRDNARRTETPRARSPWISDPAAAQISAGDVLDGVTWRDACETFVPYAVLASDAVDDHLDRADLPG